MNSRSYTIPDRCKYYSRHARPYTPRPPTPLRPPPRLKTDWRKPVMPVVTKLKPLVRYAPSTPVSRLQAPARAPGGGTRVVAAQPQAQGDAAAKARAADQRRRQEAERAEQARYQAHDQQERQRAQAQHSAQLQQASQDRERLMADQVRARQQAGANQAAARRAGAKSSGTGYGVVEPREPEDDEEEDEDEAEDPSEARPSRGGGPSDARRRAEITAEIHRQLVRNKPNAEAKEDEKPAAKGGCGNLMFFLIIGIVLLFSFGKGCINELEKMTQDNDTGNEFR